MTYTRTLYEYQDFNHFGDYGEDGFIEDYTTQIHGEPTGVIVTVARNAAGEAQHIVVNHRPRSSVLLLASLCAESSPAGPWRMSSSAGSLVPRSVCARRTCETSAGRPTTTRHGWTLGRRRHS